ncbi:hypothetical protein [Streptococcus fryi]
MSITVVNNVWYNEAGQPITETEKEVLRRDLHTELDAELADTGFEGLIKRFVSKQIDK